MEPVFQQQTSGKEMGCEHSRPGIMLLQVESSSFGAMDAEMAVLVVITPKRGQHLTTCAAEPDGSWGFPRATFLPLLTLLVEPEAAHGKATSGAEASPREGQLPRDSFPHAPARGDIPVMELVLVPPHQHPRGKIPTPKPNPSAHNVL